MYSPFPGMDPYLESQRNWTGFHHSLADEITAQLNKTIRPKYYARPATYTAYDVIEISEPATRAIYPDISLWQSSERVYANASGVSHNRTDMAGCRMAGS